MIEEYSTKLKPAHHDAYSRSSAPLNLNKIYYSLAGLGLNRSFFHKAVI